MSREATTKKLPNILDKKTSECLDAKSPLSSRLGPSPQAHQAKELRLISGGGDREQATAEHQSHASPAVLQAKEMKAVADPEQTKQIAKEGLTGTPQKLPHLDKIQNAFAGHDLSNVQAYVGGPAAKAAKEMGASAYATGDKVAFKEQPDVKTVAHEAAHVVQQREGVSLKGGVGEKGDPYEKAADAVAAKVGRGTFEPGPESHRLCSGRAAVVQLKDDPEMPVWDTDKDREREAARAKLPTEEKIWKVWQEYIKEGERIGECDDEVKEMAQRLGGEKRGKKFKIGTKHTYFTRGQGGSAKKRAKVGHEDKLLPDGSLLVYEGKPPRITTTVIKLEPGMQIWFTRLVGVSKDGKKGVWGKRHNVMYAGDGKIMDVHAPEDAEDEDYNPTYKLETEWYAQPTKNGAFAVLAVYDPFHKDRELAGISTKVERYDTLIEDLAGLKKARRSAAAIEKAKREAAAIEKQRKAAGMR